ncbi:MAG: cell surface protein SprA [Prevotellaceae bacterium]|jgi:cell surface protein SprA|nr:cell surface protein SprA [Prevotellaceae bacterium]
MCTKGRKSFVPVRFCVLFILFLSFFVCYTPVYGQEWLSTEPIVEYDVESGNYLYYYNFDKRKTKPYKVVSAEEYRREQYMNLLRKGWTAQRAEQSGGLGQANNGALPTTFNIRSDVFKTIFGSNEITINPQGNLDLTFGISHSYTDNPVIPMRYRGSTNFDFDTKMQFNIDGSIGDRVKLNFNYNTEATFDFENNLKLEFAGDEDDILQRLEAGNVALPLDGTLITGGQSLFGIKADLKFGKLLVTTIMSRQDAESKSIEIQNGGQSNLFDITADKYDANRHFFLAHHFRNKYDEYLAHLPLIVSGLNIKRVEVWVTNKSTQFDNARNLVAFMDLAESDAISNPVFLNKHSNYPDDSLSNDLLQKVNVQNLRDLANVTSSLTGLNLKSGVDFEKLENARKLNENEYKVNTQLGYISLNQALNSDEVLAVAYEYEVRGKTYRVGEFSTDGIVAPNTLVTKLLKGATFTPRLPTWKLMMKNVYSLNGYNVSEKDFLLDIMYENSEVGTTVPYLAEGNVAQKPLIRVLNLDNLNSQRDAFPDGQFDFVEGITVLSEQGKIIFPVLEPFGKYLETQIGNSEIAAKYVFKELYDSSLVNAQSMADKNRFRIVGSYLSESGAEIRLNAMNIPQGSVVVTAGGIQLQENIDYEVNYMLGTVRIINQAYLESGTPIKVSLENREMFNMQTKTLLGSHLKYKFNENFYIGATILNLSERPLTQKVNWGDEPISNTIWGINTAFTTEVPLLTKLVDALPVLETKERSSLSFAGEFAQFLPGHARAINTSGGTVFIDDFESSESALDLRSMNAWSLASTPQGQSLFPEANLSAPDLSYGYNRALCAWYSIYPEFLRNSTYTPAYMKNDPKKYQESHYVREISINEVFPEQEQVIGTPTSISLLNFAFYPDERGPYNYSADLLNDGRLLRPETRWGGIMRSLPVTDFETANYDYIEFWVMDPFVYKPNAKGGKLYFNLGNLSEDILKDGKKSFENGLPPFDDTARYETTIWGRVPKVQMLTQTFDNNYAARDYQDIGYDGLDDTHEAAHFKDYLDGLSPQLQSIISNDPSADNFKYYLDDSYDDSEATILERYKFYNNPEGNSRPNDNGVNTMGTTVPDMEDINRDYTMNESENYYQYEIDLRPEAMRVGVNYIADMREGKSDGNVKVRWYQFKIPISEGRAIGAIEDFKSIRFIRMFMRDFADTAILRFASLQLVRGDWRKYTQSLMDGRESTAQPEMTNAMFDISSVNIEENASRTPVNYVLPPGTSRQIDPGQYQARQLNEQAMMMKVVDLEDGDGRAAYKNTTFDVRQYRRLKMDVHAEALNGYPVNDNEVSVFIRIGTDYRYNYYEYEIPLSLTPHGFYSDDERERVWIPDNRLDISLDAFTDAKMERNALMKAEGGSLAAVFEKSDGKNTIRIVGNPNLGSVRTMMIGVKNPAKRNNGGDDGLPKSAIVWVNELRLTNIEENSGYAANARMTAKLADLGSITVAGSMMTPNFGSLESKINERTQDYMYQYDIAANLELGMLFPRKFGIRLPFFFGFMENYTTPKYNPFDQDITLKDATRYLTSYERDSLYRLAMDYKRRLALNFTNVRIASNSMEQRIFDPANVSLGFAYNRLFAHSAKIDHQDDISYHANIAYAYNVQPFYVDVFKKTSWLSSKYLSLINGFNFNPYPNQFTFMTDVNRTYNEVQYRSIASPDVMVPPTAAKDFTWDRNYRLLWDITRAIKLEFNANNRARIDEPEGLLNKRTDPEGYRHWQDSTWSNFWNLGRNTQYYHTYNATWTIPINKIPMLDWTSASLAYGGQYDWQAAPLLQDDTYNPGNTISNSRNINGTLNFSLENLYNKVPFLRRVNEEFSGRARKRPEMVDAVYESAKMNFTANARRIVRHKLKTTQVTAIALDADGKEIKSTVDVLDNNSIAVTLDETARGVRVKVTGRVPKPTNPVNYTAKALVRVAMMWRSFMVTYSTVDATTLPGFAPNSQIMGMSYDNNWAPGWGFVFGNQSDDAVKDMRDFLVTDTSLASPFSMANTTTWRFRAALEPFRDFRISLEAHRASSANKLSYDVFSSSSQRQVTGNFNISVLTISSAFEKPNAENDYYSKAFQTFLNNRTVIAQRLSGDRVKSSMLPYTGAPDPKTGFPDGYSPLSAEVLIPAFLSAYTGRSANKVTLDNFFNIPFPNWDVVYNGLSRLASLKDIVTSFTFMHKYEATYAVNSYNLNQQYTEGMDGFSYVRNALGDFIAERDIMNIGVEERFAPLFLLDIGWYNALSTRVEWNRGRRIGLSMSNNQITENRTNEWRVGLGYTFRDFPVLFTFLSNRKSQTPTKLTLRGDISIREDLTILRNIAQDYSGLPQLSDGKEAVTLKFSADYHVSNNVTLRLFFDRVVNTPRVTAIGTASTNAGLSINIIFAQ